MKLADKIAEAITLERSDRTAAREYDVFVDGIACPVPMPKAVALQYHGMLVQLVALAVRLAREPDEAAAPEPARHDCGIAERMIAILAHELAAERTWRYTSTPTTREKMIAYARAAAMEAAKGTP